jgi:simple sugar transport system ATP-binding protein
LGVGFVPEDRLHDGLVGDYSVAENLVLDLYKRPPYGRRFSIDLAAVNANAERRIAEFDVRTQSPSEPASTLSGGNQQKVVLAREMSRPLKLLIVSQPTRGLDVGSMEFVHRRLIAERDTGTAIILVSTELDEVLGLADRIAVMYRGQILAEVPGGASAETVGLLMAGSVPADLAARNNLANDANRANGVNPGSAPDNGSGPGSATGKGEAESA